MKPLLIVGPTASGKTELSFWLAEHMPAELVKAGVDILVIDSKQVYTHQDIVTGKDIDKKFKQKNNFYSYKNIRLFGIDLVSPDEDWSVAQSIAYAEAIIRESRKLKRFLIIVGGTPQYVLSVFELQPSFSVQPDEKLRTILEADTVLQLQEKLRQIDHSKLESMNHSDRNNPRRLIRAIEVSQKPPTDTIEEPLLLISECYWIGLSPEKETMVERIKRRVQKRIENGAVEEFRSLSQTFPNWKKEAKAAIGYHEIEQFTQGFIDMEQLIALWTLHEVQYAKRQMTWWKREQQIVWYSALTSDLKEQVLSHVKDCYNSK